MNSIKINKIVLCLFIIFGVSLVGCVTIKKVADAIIPDIILPDSVLYPEKEKGETKAEQHAQKNKPKTPTTVQNQELSTKSGGYVGFLVVCGVIASVLLVIKLYLNKKELRE